MAGVVVGVDELVRAAGRDVEKPVTRDAVGQAHHDAAVIAVAHGHLAQVATAAQVVALARAIGIAAEPDHVVPAAGVGDADAAVGHRPLHRQLAAAVGGAGRADRLNPQVGISDGQYIGGVAGALLVVGLQRVFPDRAGGIGLHKHRAVAARGRAEAVGQAAAVAGAGGQRAVMHHIAQHGVVGIAEHVIAAVDDAVGPAGAAAGAHTLVADRPLHGDAGRVVNHLGGRGHGQHGQVGISVLRNGHSQAVLVVVLAGGFVVGATGIGNDDQAPAAKQINRQRDGARAVGAGACGQRGDVALCQQQVGAVHHAVLGQVQLFVDVGRVGTAGIAGLPVDDDHLAALQQAAGADRTHHQIGRHHGHGLAGGVVGFVGLADIGAPVGHHLQPPVARRQGRHGQAQALGQRAAGAQAAKAPGAGQHLGGRDPQGIDQADFFAEEAVNRVVAAVAHRVVQLHGLAHAPVGGRGDANNLQIGLGLGPHGGGIGGNGHVVGDAAQLIHRRKGVGLDDEILRTGSVARHGEIQPGGIALAHAQRAHAGNRAQQHRLRGEASAAAEVDLIDPAVHVGGHGAAIADGPLHPCRTAGKNFGRHHHQRGRQIGIGLGDCNGRGQAGVVGAGVGLVDLGRGIADHRQPVAALDAAGDAHGGTLAVGCPDGQRGAARHFGQHGVVAIAGGVVGRQHDAVNPATGSGGGRCAVVGDGPVQRQLGASVDGVGAGQRRDGQVGVSAQQGGKAAGCIVVGLGRAAGIGLKQHTSTAGAAVNADSGIKLAGAPGAFGQHKAVAACAGLPRRQRRSGRAGKADKGVQQQRTGAAVGIALADDQAVLVRQVGGHQALVDIVPAQRQHIARRGVGLDQADVAGDQVGADIDVGF